MDTFGCCSHYKKCSDLGKCIFPNNPDYDGCYYSKNLEEGKNFYSEKVIPIVVKPVVKPVVKWESERKIFLDCYDRNFKIGHRGSRNGFSYPLSKDEHDLLLDNLFNLGIPHVTETEEGKCILEGTDQEPANSKVIFSVPGYEKEFIIGNYNQAFILKRYADGIAKALQKKGITARVECFGTYSAVRSYPPKKPVQFQDTPEEKEKVYLCQQVSIFDLVSV